MNSEIKKLRLNWLDSLRGCAILFLIIMHYIGAVEARGLIPVELVDYVKSIFRVATPLFITVFGFTISYIFYGKVSAPHDLKKIVFWSLKRLPKVLLAREFIVLLYSLSHPEKIPSLIDTLLYMQFSQAGEILTFYFVAILVTPYILYLVYSYSFKILLPIFSVIYFISYFIGVNYSSPENSGFFRLFFYDVYPFFPFYACVISGIYLAILYLNLSDDVKRLKVFFSISIAAMLIGLLYLNTLTSSLLHDLSFANFKAPPHPAYLMLYTGLSVFISILIALAVNSYFFPRKIERIFIVIGRNSLLAYVLHYFLHFTVPITIFLTGSKNTIVEVLIFLMILITIFYVLKRRNNYKG